MPLPLSLAFLTAAAPPFLVQAVAIVVAAALIAYLSTPGPGADRRLPDRRRASSARTRCGWSTTAALVDAAAEIGVILLLFTIGIEFSLEKLARIKTLIFGGGGLQVALRQPRRARRARGARRRLARRRSSPASSSSLSSTAIVLKLLGDRGETASPHGQVDARPADLPGPRGHRHGAGRADARRRGAARRARDRRGARQGAGADRRAVLVVARRLMPPLLERVALHLLARALPADGHRDLLRHRLAHQPRRRQPVARRVPRRPGRQREPLQPARASARSCRCRSSSAPRSSSRSACCSTSASWSDHLPLVLAAVALVVVVKIGDHRRRACSRSATALPVAAASALTLAQVGEFSFVLERAGRDVGLSPAGLGDTGSQAFIASTVVLMVATPQLTALGSRLRAERLKRRHVRADGRRRGAAATSPPRRSRTSSTTSSSPATAKRRGSWCACCTARGSRSSSRRSARAARTKPRREGLPVLRGDSRPPAHARTRRHRARQGGGHRRRRPGDGAADCRGGALARADGAHHRPDALRRRDRARSSARRARPRGRRGARERRAAVRRRAAQLPDRAAGDRGPRGGDPERRLRGAPARASDEPRRWCCNLDGRCLDTRTVIIRDGAPVGLDVGALASRTASSGAPAARSAEPDAQAPAEPCSSRPATSSCAARRRPSRGAALFGPPGRWRRRSPRPRRRRHVRHRDARVIISFTPHPQGTLHAPRSRSRRCIRARAAAKSACAAATAGCTCASA